MKVLDIDGLNYYDGKIKQTYAPLASPTLTGTPTAPTPTSGDNSTKLATTAYVQGALSGATPTSIADTEIQQYWTGVTPEQVNQFLSLSGGTMTGNIILSDGGSPLSTVGGTMSGAIKFGAFAGKILDFGGTGHGNLSLQEENDHQVIYFSANTNGGYPPEGAQLILHSVDGNGGYGNAIIRVGNDGSTCKDLRMFPSGSLTWDDKDVDVIDSKSIGGDGYIKYNNGMLICWHHAQYTGATNYYKSVTFAQPFTTLPTIVTGGESGYATSWGTTGFSLHGSSQTSFYGSYIAFGKWK